VTDRVIRFPRISPISLFDSKIARGGRDRQERQRHIEIGEEELDANPVRVAKNTPYAVHRLKPHATALKSRFTMCQMPGVAAVTTACPTQSRNALNTRQMLE
jgi:hypothetical protein